MPACSSGTLANVLPRRYAMPQRHRTWHPTRHRIQTRGQNVVLSNDVERYTGINNFPLLCFGSDPIGKSFLHLSHTPANAQIYDTDMVVVSWKLIRKCTVTTGSWTRACVVLLGTYVQWYCSLYQNRFAWHCDNQSTKHWKSWHCHLHCSETTSLQLQ